ncbi:U3 small nucleolar ribonucleoprotein MPP10 [Ananas comosus]|uniref:U3 small nucleolar ribonucleoprotein MPP10 n=1 Tax=Ananas comosus TaxID=4615 RepID=A0A199VNY5_ANACO|nr:U3 small nucleolar ribonucleoprotein MPP10 [Ananas comosus]
MAMTSTVRGGEEKGATTKGEAALERLRSADPARYLSPSPKLSSLARAASSHLFSSLVPLCPNPPIDRLLAGEGFDAEQVWFQVDLLSRPLLALLRRELRRFERDPPSFAPMESVGGGGGGKEAAEEEEGVGDDRFDDEDDEEEEREEGDGDDDEDEREDDDDDDDDKEEEEEEEDEEEGGKRVGVLEDFDDDASEEADGAENARYEDFYGGKTKKGHDKKDGGKKKKSSSKKVQFLDDSRDMEMDAEQDDHDENETKVLSTHEKELQKMRLKIEQMEKANLEPKSWTMQGEVTAAKRPKNSALEVDLDFEHRTRPAPVITEEVTASLEEMIKKRIIENLFDDVQRAPVLPYKAPKEHKELDENKSKKGLAEIYEEEYAQKTGLASAPPSVSDEQKREASALFKNICLKLDALSHFHFAPKPVIEDMSIQANVPALAMEEIAPVAVSDAAMLAPEEIFEGKGDIKAEGELTQAERRRRRANKKRKFKAKSAKRAAKKPRESADLNHTSGN